MGDNIGGRMRDNRLYPEKRAHNTRWHKYGERAAGFNTLTHILMVHVSISINSISWAKKLNGIGIYNVSDVGQCAAHCSYRCICLMCRTEVVAGAGITSCATLSLGHCMGTVPHSSEESRLGTANVYSRNVLSLVHGTMSVRLQGIDSTALFSEAATYQWYMGAVCEWKVWLAH